MGCVTLGTRQIATGVIVPEQEMIINMTERKHPFSSIEVTRLFKEFSQAGLVNKVAYSVFYEWCLSIEVDTNTLKDKYSRYIDLISLPDSEIDVHLLLVTGILLAKGSFFNKILKLIKIYSKNVLVLTKDGIMTMLVDLIYVSTMILPALSKEAIKEDLYHQYIKRIKCCERVFVEKFMRLFEGPDLVSQTAFLKVFEDNKELQKICWPNGVRMLLIEEQLVDSYG